MRILLTGASGFIGQHLLTRLEKAGHEVIALRRGTRSTSPQDWQVPADLRLIGSAVGWPARADAVIHLAAANPVKGEDAAADFALLRTANVEGTLALTKRAAQERVRRIVFLSSANVHPPRVDGGMITERDPIDPQSAYAASKAEAELVIRKALASTQTEYCILRPAPVFGEGGRGTVAKLARLAATPLPLPLRGFGGRRSLIAVQDLVDAIVLSLDAPGAANETLLLAGGAATPAEIVSALRKGAGRSPCLLPAPARLVGALARRLGKDRAFDNLTRDFVLDTKRAQEALAWKTKRELADRLSDNTGHLAKREH